MATFVLPNTQSGGIQYIDATSLQDAEQKAQSGGTWSPAAGTYGANSSSGGSGSGSGDGSSEYYTTGQHYASQDANEAARDAATKAYQQSLAQNNSDTLAFEKAKEAAAEAYQQQQLGLGALQLSGSLTGPRNAFAQQQVNYGLNAQGFSPLAGALAGQYSLPTFQAPQGTPQAASLSTLAQDISQGTGFTSTPGGAVNQGSAQAFLNGLPAPHQIVASQWNALPQDTQSFLLSAYGAKGFSANDVQDAIKSNLPTFKAPSFASADAGAN